jgi:hypothetical protein
VLQPAAIANLFTLGASNGGHGFDSARVINAAAGQFYGMKGTREQPKLRALPDGRLGRWSSAGTGTTSRRERRRTIRGGTPIFQR